MCWFVIRFGGFTLYKKYKKEFTVSYSLGMTATLELLLKKYEAVNKIYIHPRQFFSKSYDLLVYLCSKHGIPLVENDKIFNILSQKENCYIIGEFNKYSNEMDLKRSHIVLVNPSNAGNLGTIIRTCKGFGINDLIIIGLSVDTFDPKVIRASMGAIFSMNIIHFNTFEEYMKKCNGHHFYPFMINTECSLKEIKIIEPFSFIFGNESSGLPMEFNKIGQKVTIKHSKEIDSLNISVAVGIALYEATKKDKG
jgi:TrmH family RNA methyltransferase